MKLLILAIALSSLSFAADKAPEKKDTIININGQRDLGTFNWEKNTLELNKGVTTEDIVRELIADVSKANQDLAICNDKLKPAPKAPAKK